jgi:hypothetical protein
MPAYGIALIVATWVILSGLVAGLALKWGREPASWFSLSVVASPLIASGAYCLADSPPRIGGKMKLHLQWSPEMRQSELVLKAVGTMIRVDPQPEGNYGFAVKFNVPLLSIR